MARHIDLKPIEDEAPGLVAEVVDEGKDGDPWQPSRARCGGLVLHWTGWKMNAGYAWITGQWFTILNGDMYYASHPGGSTKSRTGFVFNMGQRDGQEFVYQYSEERLLKGLRAATLVRLVNLLAKEGVIGGVKREERQDRIEAYPMWPQERQNRTESAAEEILAYWRPRLDQESMAMVCGLVGRAMSSAPESSWMSLTELGLLSHLTSGGVRARLAILLRSPVNLVEMHPSGLLFRARRDTLFLDQPQPQPDTYQWSPRYFYHPPYTSGVAVPSSEQQAITQEQRAIAEAERRMQEAQAAAEVLEESENWA